MATEQNIKVAVRLRPFISSIKEDVEGKAKRIVRMDELSSTVSLTNPDDRSDIQNFIFDSILWSFDGFSEQADGYLAPENKAVSEEIYCDQKQVYEEVGKEAVQNLWSGCNSTVFTFGEGKSGKSWTLFGLRVNKGIIPLALTDIFKGVKEKEKTLQQTGSPPEVRICMAEIYNEKVKDLLPAPTLANSTKLKSNAKIREHSKKGYYIEGLRSVIVINHEDIQQRLEEGLVNRAIFLTSTNATVENSLTFISITLVQKIRNHRGDEVTKTASVDFIDLPACKINEVRTGSSFDIDCRTDDSESSFLMNCPKLRSNGIDCLVHCVNSLLESSIGKHNDTVPFHSHPVTKILKNGLVGNSKSYMIATLSPSEVAYQNSLFVLKFAEKVRMLSTNVAVNEEVTSKLIRELKGENEKLRKLISLGEFETNGLTNQLEQFAAATSASERDAIRKRIIEDMRAQVREHEKEIKNLQQPLDERLKPFKAEKSDVGKKIENDRKSKCHLFNLNADAQVSGKIIHIIPLGTIDFGHSTSGSGKGRESSNFISFFGPGIQEHHGTFTYNIKDGKFSIKPSGPNCRVLVNEIPIQFDTTLGNNDRIGLGGCQLWIFQNPKETWLEKYTLSHKLHYEYIMDEMALQSTHYKELNRNGSLTEYLKQQSRSLVEALDTAKSIVEDLNQPVSFQPLLQHPIEYLVDGNCGSGSDAKTISYSDMITEADEDESGKGPKILVKVQNSVERSFYYWSTDKFYDRLEMMKSAFMQYLEDGDVPLKEIEALKEKSDLEVPIGYSIICIKPLGYMMNIENPSVPILDYINFSTIGTFNFSLCWYDESFGEKLDDLVIFVESPEELIDASMPLILTIQELQNVNYQFKEIYCKYKFLDEEEEATKFLDLKAPSIITGLESKFERKMTIGPVTDNTLNLILTQYLILRFFGKQRTHKLLNLVENMHSDEPLQYKRNSPNPAELERTMTELKVKEKVEIRHQRRLNALRSLMEQSTELGEESVPVTVMRTLLEAKSQKYVNQRLEEHKELLTPVPEEPEEKQLPPELKALKRFSEICSIF